MQNSGHLLMIEPVRFGYNAETAVNNAFQVPSGKPVQEAALQEFNGLVKLLNKNDVRVTVIKDSPEPHTPDSIFPNNWISFHEDGRVFLYPMFAENRRRERKPHILDTIKQLITVTSITDLSHYETEGRFLEGTGSMVLDRVNRIAYACLSPRTDKGLLEEFCRIAGYTPVSFIAKDLSGKDIYHTNVMMCLADQYVIVCLEAVLDDKERQMLCDSFSTTGKEIIEISQSQVQCFAGNMLQVKNSKHELLLVMSQQAYLSLNAGQVEKLEKYNRIIYTNLDVIESNGGGSVRCVMAEVGG